MKEKDDKRMDDLLEDELEEPDANLERDYDGVMAVFEQRKTHGRDKGVGTPPSAGKRESRRKRGK